MLIHPVVLCSSIVKWYYERAWNTMNGAKRAIVAKTVDFYLGEIAADHRTVKFNIPENPEDGDQFLECNKKNIKIIDDFFCRQCGSLKTFSRQA